MGDDATDRDDCTSKPPQSVEHDDGSYETNGGFLDWLDHATSGHHPLIQKMVADNGYYYAVLLVTGHWIPCTGCSVDVSGGELLVHLDVEERGAEPAPDGRAWMDDFSSWRTPYTVRARDIVMVLDAES